MLHWIFEGDGLFKLITFRSALAGITSFLMCLLIGPRVIAWLRARKVGEDTAKEDSRRLDQLMKDKKDTPTMGGVFILIAILSSTLLFGDLGNGSLWVVMGAVVADRTR